MSSIPSHPLARTLTRRCTHCPCRLQLASELPVFSPHVGRGSSFKLSGLRKGSSLVGVEDQARVTCDLGGRPGGQSQEAGLLTSCHPVPAACSHKAPGASAWGQQERGTRVGGGISLTDTLQALPSPLSGARHNLTAPDSTIFSGPLAVSSGTYVPWRFPALLSLSRGGRGAGRQPPQVPVPAHFP